MEKFKMGEYIPPSTKILFQSGKEYHVFLSFKGEDVRKNLVDHLYEALTAAGLHVFLDTHKLKKGNPIWSSLERAIESSAICIPIFSKGYADSKWCLREATTMVNTQGLIIPLFYDVDPTDVRYPLKDSSQYKQAFLKHYDHPDRYQTEEIEGWKDAVHQICSRSGWSKDITGGFEGQLVKRVVNDVINNNFSRLRINGGNSQGLEALNGSGLLFLHLENLPIEGITRATLPPNLIWLRLKNCEKPFHFSLMRTIWSIVMQGPFQFSLVDNIWDLRIMQVDDNISNLQYSLSNILGKLSQLQQLELRNYRKLNKVPRTIRNLSQLQRLDLGWCAKLNKVPHTIGKLPQLKYLDLSWCQKLSDLPHSIGNLSQLQHLDLSAYESLNSLPDTIGNLSQLQYLNLNCCKKLNNLSRTIGNLSNLHCLDLGGCTKLNKVPNTFANLSQLRHLDLSFTKLNKLPRTIDKLSQLQYLELNQCQNLNDLPYTIGNLSQLQHLDLSYCEYLYFLLNTIGNLSQLRYLNLVACTKLSNLPDTIGNLSMLQIFR